jgi:hypothetical protein
VAIFPETARGLAGEDTEGGHQGVRFSADAAIGALWGPIILQSEDGGYSERIASPRSINFERTERLDHRKSSEWTQTSPREMMGNEEGCHVCDRFQSWFHQAISPIGNG